MQLIGHELVDFKPLFWCEKIEQIKAGRINFFKFNSDFIKYAKSLNADFAVSADSATQIIIANAAGARYIVIDRDFKKISKMAEYYLFDAKICVVIEDENELINLTKAGIDTAIFKKGIVNGDI